jgi:anthranilate phosphoribosyltransferase
VLANAIEKLAQEASLTRAEARAAMETVLRGDAVEEQIVALLAGLRQKGETLEELVGFAEAIRAHAPSLFSAGERPALLVDTCGTGGDGTATFNISTAAAFVVAGAGTHVAKHGNRSVSSRCGSADVLEAMGVNVQIDPLLSARAITDVGIGFLFAPLVHTAMKHAHGARRKLGGRTIFNLLGPLTNPAGVEAQVVGVSDPQWLDLMAQALQELGTRRAFVVCSRDGLDEASLSDATEVRELNPSGIRRYQVTPENFGLLRAPREAITGGDAKTNAKIIERVLSGEQGPQRDVVLMNASLALVAAGRAGDFRQGVEQSRAAVDSGAAGQRLRALVEFTNR